MSRLTAMYHPSAHPEGVFNPYVAVDRLYPGYWSGPDYSRAEFKMPIIQNPLQTFEEPGVMSGLGEMPAGRKEEIEHAVLGAGLVATFVSVLGCKKGWKLWTVGLGALLGAAGGYGYTHYAKKGA